MVVLEIGVVLRNIVYVKGIVETDTREPMSLGSFCRGMAVYRYNACGFIGKSALIF